MNVYKKFKAECDDEISAMGENKTLAKLTNEWMRSVNKLKYSYHFDFLGRPIIQYPQDMVVIQELIWKVKPDLIIETGIAHGGSLIMSASILALLDICDAIENEIMFNPKDSKRKVLGIDIDIKSHNRKAIESHPMSSRIEMIEGSSISPNIIKKVKKISNNYKCIMLFLDSNHTHNHVLKELKAYSPLVSVGSYCIVFDTIIESMPENTFTDKRSWGLGNNPKTAVCKFLKTHPEFRIDKKICNKLLITVAPDGYLKRIKK
jgi:cephalosporin hydroxylase